MKARIKLYFRGDTSEVDVEGWYAFATNQIGATDVIRCKSNYDTLTDKVDQRKHLVKRIPF